MTGFGSLLELKDKEICYSVASGVAVVFPF